MNPGHFYLSNEVTPFNLLHNIWKGWAEVNNEKHTAQTPKDKRNWHWPNNTLVAYMTPVLSTGAKRTVNVVVNIHTSCPSILEQHTKAPHSMWIIMQQLESLKCECRCDGWAPWLHALSRSIINKRKTHGAKTNPRLPTSIPSLFYTGDHCSPVTTPRSCFCSPLSQLHRCDIMLMMGSHTDMEAEEMQSQWVPSFLQGARLGSGVCLNSVAPAFWGLTKC